MFSVKINGECGVFGVVYHDIEIFCKKNMNRKKQFFVYSNHVKYIRICAGFDIETTRIEKHAFMYHCQISWNDDELLLRHWDDFHAFCDRLQEWLNPKNANIIIWVANLGHEFSFLCRRFRWKKIFARESHSPLTATTGRIEFRECLSISGQGGLANLAKNYCKTRKLKGDLDFSILRNSQTVLQPETEEQYTINDVRILSEWAKYIFTEFSDKGKDIPLTGTSIVRSDIKQAAEKTGCIEQIKQAVISLYPKRETYNFVMEFLFRGGYTHANIWYVCVKWDNTIGVDFTSSYPAVMLQCYYPMTPFCEFDCKCDGKTITDKRIETDCVIVVCEFDMIEQTTYHSIESKHKLIKYENAIFDNGRLARADKIQVCLTELDYQTYCDFYKWKSMRVLRALCANRGRLPNYVLNPLKSYYETKQTLKQKGLDKTNEYKNAKARLNSFYGCMVTRLTFIENRYNQNEPFTKDGKIIETGAWYTEETTKTYSKLISNQLLSPYWGIYVTAHARRRLLQTVYEMDRNPDTISVIYCDTDSIYFDDTPANRAIIAEYNRKTAEYNAQNLPPVFADIGLYDWVDKDKNKQPVKYEFETLGAKRYIKYYDNHAEITIAGMRKGTMEKSILRQFANDNTYPLYEKYEDENGNTKKRRLGYVDKNELFAKFTDEFILSVDESMKLASYYDNNEYSAVVTDEQGHTETMHEMCGVALVPITFQLKMDEVYIMLLEKIMNERRLPVWK